MILQEYSESYKGDFPTGLSQLCTSVAKCLGFLEYKPEAAIVNYYTLDSSLGGHTGIELLTNFQDNYFSIQYP